MLMNINLYYYCIDLSNPFGQKILLCSLRLCDVQGIHRIIIIATYEKGMHSVYTVFSSCILYIRMSYKSQHKWKLRFEG